MTSTEFTENAIEELKRADHLLYVSLKYTRTCDVMKNIIKRLINAFDLEIKEVLEFAKSKKKIKEIPLSAKEKTEAVKKLMGGSVKKYIKLYELMKVINKADFVRKEEYRKNVALITKTKKPIIIKMDTLFGYFGLTKDFVFLVDKWTRRLE